jgi:hypothetical protein
MSKLCRIKVGSCVIDDKCFLPESMVSVSYDVKGALGTLYPSEGFRASTKLPASRPTTFTSFLQLSRQLQYRK